MANGPYFQIDADNKIKYMYSRILTIITEEMGKLNTYSPI